MPKKNRNNGWIDIYVIKNKIDGKMYVGQSIWGAEKRWSDHVNDAKRDSKRGCVVLYRAIRLCGPESFDVSVIDRVRTRDSSNVVEALWIERLDTLAPNGYNIEKVGRAGRVRSPESVLKSSDGQRRRWSNASEDDRKAAGKWLHAKDPEIRSQLAKNNWLNASPDRRAERIAGTTAGNISFWHNLTPEFKAEQGRRVLEGRRRAKESRAAAGIPEPAPRSAESRSAASKKGWETKKSKSAKAK